MKISSCKQSSLHDEGDDINNLICLALVALKCIGSCVLEAVHAVDEVLAALLAQIVICTHPPTHQFFSHSFLVRKRFFFPHILLIINLHMYHEIHDLILGELKSELVWFPGIRTNLPSNCAFFSHCNEGNFVLIAQKALHS